MPSSIRRIHSTYLGQKVFPKKMSEFEIREFFTLNVADKGAIRVDSPSKTRLALALQLGFVRMTGTTLDAYDYVPRPVLEFLGKQLKVGAPMLATLRALYRRRMTRFRHQAWGALDFAVKSRCGAVAVGSSQLWPPLSSGGVSIDEP